MWGKEHGCLPGQRTGSWSSEFPGAALLSWLPGRGSGRWKDGSLVLAGPLTQGKSLEIKVKAPCCCPRPGLPLGGSPPATRGGRKLFKFLIKLLSFHAGSGRWLFFNELDHNPRPYPLYRTFPHQRRGQIPPSVPPLTQSKPCQRILGIVPNHKTQLLTQKYSFKYLTICVKTKIDLLG